MKKDTIKENEDIQNGLERFLEDELLSQTKQSEHPKASVDPIVFSNTAEPDITMIYGDTVKKQLNTDSPHKSKTTSQKSQTALPRQSQANKKQTKPSKAFTKSQMETDKSNTQNRKNKKNTQKANTKKVSKKKQKNKASGRKSSKLKLILTIACILIIGFLVLWYLFVGNAYQKMTYVKSDAGSSLKKDGVINVLLIGNDSRENGDDGRSDAMILLSISQNTKKIYMTSLLRDMYVDIPGHDGNRLNAAYSYGGAELLMETIKLNLGIDVDHYVLVNFQAFANLVDAVGGIDLELSNEEVGWVNAYLNEYNLLQGRDITTDYLDPSLSGTIHLNGPQALAYCRNRYIGTDFGRTERQRKVLSEIIKKMPLYAVTNTNGIIDGLFPNLTTNLTQTECYRLSFYANKFLTYDTEQLTIPAEGTYSNATIRQMQVLEVDFDANRRIWEEAVYAE